MRSEEVSFSGPKGLASVKVLKNSVKVTFSSGKVWEGSSDECPDGIFSTPEAFVSLDREETKVRGFRPFSGTFIASFVELWHKKDMQPAPSLKPAKGINWLDKKTGEPRSTTIPTHQEFTAVLQLHGEPWDGLKVFAYPWYMFEEDTDGTSKQVGPGNEITKVNALLRFIGFDFANDTISYSDNVLPELQLILKSKGEHVFMVEIDKGYIKQYKAMPVGMGAPTKKARRGRPKKVADVAPDEED